MSDVSNIGQDEKSGSTNAPQLSAIELRVLGALMEKELTTPDLYPLTVNSIVTACNQKSSREPVSHYQQGEIVRTLKNLEEKNFVRREYGSRAEKYSQQFMRFLELDKKQQAVLSVMMLRGVQTLSELDTRTQRMGQFTDREELVHSVERLCDRELPYALRLGVQPGQRGERFGHLFCGVPELSDYVAPMAAKSTSPQHTFDQEALSLLELEVAELCEKVTSLKNENRSLKAQIDKLYELTGHMSNESSPA